MSHELSGARRAAIKHLIAEHEAAIARQEPYDITRETIIMALQQVQHGWVYAGQAVRILAETAARVRDEPEKVALVLGAPCASFNLRRRFCWPLTWLLASIQLSCITFQSPAEILLASNSQVVVALAGFLNLFQSPPEILSASNVAGASASSTP